MLVLALLALASASAAMQQPSSSGARAPPITRAEVAKHQSRDSFWAVVDVEGVSYVVDVTGFVPHHPGGDKIFGATAGAHFSFSRGANAHFAHTASAVRSACRAFDKEESPVDLTFTRSRANGGLDRNGQPVGPTPATPVGNVTVLGRLAR